MSNYLIVEPLLQGTGSGWARARARPRVLATATATATVSVRVRLALIDAVEMCNAGCSLSHKLV